jgi:hypothetical protein
MNCARVLVLGINPSNGKRVKQIITLKRLPQWMNTIGVDKYDFANCIPYKGRYCQADVDLKDVRRRCMSYDRVIALGNFPSAVLVKIGVRHFKLPHPSGLNRLLNNAEYVRDCLDRCRKYVYDS